MIELPELSDNPVWHSRLFYQQVLIATMYEKLTVTVYVVGGVGFRGEIIKANGGGVMLRRPGSDCFIMLSDIRAVSVDEKT
jgi:sRNA-binding regulator protein Hfq